MKKAGDKNFPDFDTLLSTLRNLDNTPRYYSK